MKVALKRYLLLIIALTALLPALNAQVVVEQKTDSVGILIGQQLNLHLTVTAPRGARISFPSYKPTEQITPGVEVLKEAVGDTVEVEGDKIQLTKTYTLTSFDEHLYAIPAMKVRVNGKQYLGVTVPLKVITMDVDTLHPDQFFPPKDVQDNPFLWKEWSPLLWLSLLVLLLCAAAAYMWIRMKQNKPIVTRIRIVRHIPPHQRALNEIEHLKAEHMTGSEDQKAYYTRLTDTLRRYINDRFGFNAMEMTSGEIIDRLRESGDQKMISELTELFRTADLVKFAKYSTLINENDLNLVNAVNFIDETKTDAKETEERIAPTLSENDERSRRTRRIVKIGMWLAIAVAAACLVAVAIGVYRLTM